jgi:RNA polymerase sigma factor (sigma-70 family)
LAATFLENEVWAQVGKGNQDAYAQLYVFYYKRLYNYGRKFTSDTALLEDALQEALMTVWTGRDRLNALRTPHTYLFNSFRFILFRRVRAAKRLSPYTDAHEGEPEFGVEQMLIRQDAEIAVRQRLEQAVRGLTSRQREAIFLRFYEGLSYEEVAEVMGISVKATYKLMARALLELKETLSLPLLALLVLLRHLS